MNDAISFPGLGLSFNPPRAAFTIFEHTVYYYGIIMACAFLAACIYCMKRAARLGIGEEDFIDAIIAATPVAIICARLYFVVFSWENYALNPISILYIWEGGVAVYGAIIGAFVTVIIFSKIRRVNMGSLFDLGALGFVIGQAIGRWGNFINREAYGAVTSLPWRMEIYDYTAAARIAVHPAFLYESLWNILGFILLHIRSRNRKFCGEIFLLYMTWYGLGRAFIEGLRTDSLYLFDTGIRVSQMLGIICFFAGVLLLFYNYIFRIHDPDSLLPLEAGTKKSGGKKTAADKIEIEKTEDKEAEDKAGAEAEKDDA